MAWTDDPLSVNVKYKAVHIEELRNRVDTLSAISCPTNNITFDVTDRTVVDNTHFLSNFNDNLIDNFVVHDLIDDGAVHNRVNGVHDSANLTSHDNGYDYGDDGAAESLHRTGVDTALNIGVNSGEDSSAYSANYVGNDASNYYSNLSNQDSAINGAYDIGNDASHCPTYCSSHNSGQYVSALDGVNNIETVSSGGGTK